MNQNHPASRPAKPTAPNPGFDLASIYFVLFRHWKLLVVFAVISVVSAAVAYVRIKPTYTSEAELIVKYVEERKAFAPNPQDSQVMSTDNRGENIMNSEVEIFKSFDLALEVAELIGPEKVLAKLGGGTNRISAAVSIRGGTKVEPLRKSNIMLVSFTHPDAELVQTILTRLIEVYKNRHKEIHRSLGPMDDIIKRQRDALRLALSDTESELLKVQTNNGILSIEESKRALTERISRLSEQVATAEAQLAEARMEATTAGWLPVAGTNTAAVGTNAAATKPITAATPPSTNTDIATVPTPPAAAIPPETLDAFKAAKSEVELLERREKDLLKQYTEIHPAARRVRTMLTDARSQLAKLETNNPGIRVAAALTASTTPGLGVSTNPASPSTGVLMAGTFQGAQHASNVLAGLEAKLANLKTRYRESRIAADELVNAETKLVDLRRTKEAQEKHFLYYQSTLDQVSVDEALGPGKVRGINDIQRPSVPIVDQKLRLKFTLGSLLIPFLLALAFAFSNEMILDRTIKRPSEMETRTGVPLFVSIPNKPLPSMENGARRLSLPTSSTKQLPAGSSLGTRDDEDLRTEAAETASITPPATLEATELDPFFETLRDRLVAFFDKNNMTHKPKLVAITGCHSKAGVTTVVAGLASSLSNCGDGNVLVVDMKSEGGAVQHFFRGKQQVGLMDVLDESRRSEAQVQENLYVVSEQDLHGSLPKILHKRFAGLVPKLKLSNYDYIIFDLPPMSQTSIAPRVARFMDMMLIVAEAEKTHSELVRQSARMLSENGANVGAVLNRTRNHIPQRFSHELT
ncbi:MAG: hypothetical protein HY299_05550 [Verrucomicrobia bacterium]|nr:hypothetical protein [Verrucomicrobiota bacterium]